MESDFTEASDPGLDRISVFSCVDRLRIKFIFYNLFIISEDNLITTDFDIIDRNWKIILDSVTILWITLSLSMSDCHFFTSLSSATSMSLSSTPYMQITIAPARVKIQNMHLNQQNIYNKNMQRKAGFKWIIRLYSLKTVSIFCCCPLFFSSEFNASARNF